MNSSLWKFVEYALITAGLFIGITFIVLMLQGV